MNARDYALAKLDRLSLPGWPAHALPPAAAHRATPPTDLRELALAEQLYIGVLKNLLLLQHLTAHFTRRPLHKLDPAVQKILSLGLYQLRFLNRIPASAAVSEAVEQCRRMRQPHAVGLVNASLRGATRQPHVPLSPREDAEAHAEIQLSHPRELFARLRAIRGDDWALAACIHNNSEPPTILRLGASASVDMLGVGAQPHEQPGYVVVHGARKKELALWAQSGLAQVQDPTAGKVVSLLPLSPGMVVLDRCCGVGTKSLQLAQSVGSSGRVVAIDPAPARCQALRSSCAALGISTVQVYESETVPPLAAGRPEHFDLALLDLPCSNSGVLARRPEARYTQTPQRLESLRRLQMQIVEDTLPTIRAGGCLAYSTCSIWPEENQEQLQRILHAHPQWQLIHEEVTLPSCTTTDSHYHDGGYLALLRAPLALRPDGP
jgi:16S rRNA (cytosine967-C5)-methyltransferase